MVNWHPLLRLARSGGDGVEAKPKAETATLILATELADFACGDFVAGWGCAAFGLVLNRTAGRPIDPAAKLLARRASFCDFGFNLRSLPVYCGDQPVYDYRRKRNLRGFSAVHWARRPRPMNRIFLTLFLLISLSLASPMAFAQTKTQKSDEILRKARQLDLLNHILPLVLTKSQIEQLLTPIEKCRKKVKEIEGMEADDLIKMETKVDAVLAKGYQNDLVPSRDLLREMNRLFNAFRIRRQIAASENADIMLEAMKKILNAGQLTTAEKSIDLKAYDPTADPEKISADDKLKFFIKDILLDPLSYDVLTKMLKDSKNKP